MDLGLEVGAVRLVPHDGRWAAAFDALSAVLGSALPRDVVTIEHVGSTAVAGMVAKPILDVAVALPPRSEVQTIVAGLVRAGCIDRGTVDSAGEDRMLAIEPAPGVRVAHVHLVAHGGPAWRGYLGFRDALRESSAARRRYEDEKARLHAQCVARDVYRRAKSAVIEEILAGR